MSTYNPLNAYRETKVKTASPGKIIIMIYDEAVRQLDVALTEMEKGDKQLDKMNAAILRAQDMITELMVSLDFDKGQEIAQNLFNLYMFFNQELIQANINKDPEPIRKIRALLADLRDTWKQVVAKAGLDSNRPQTGGVNIAG